MVRLGKRHLPRLRVPGRSHPPTGPGPDRPGVSLNDDVLELDQAQWQTTWRKGGVGTGVLALAYLATTPTGQSYVVTVFAQNRSQPIDPATAAPVVLSAMKGAFKLAARR
jgi:hypothetical protein